MKHIYFFTFAVKGLHFNGFEMCELHLAKPIRSFGDIIKAKEIISQQLASSIGENHVTIINFKKLEEETEYEKKGEEVEQEDM